MSKLSALIVGQSACRQDTNRILKVARRKGLETVVIVGMRADGSVWSVSSAGTSHLKTLGALELAKHDILEDWKAS